MLVSVFSKRKKNVQKDDHVFTKLHILKEKMMTKSIIRIKCITYFKGIWKLFIILGLIRAQEILKLEPETRVYLRKMEAHPEMMYNMFTDMKDKEEYRVVLDCKTSSIVPILQKVN